MRRYQVPRIVFINKLDRAGADPWRVVQQLKTKLRLNPLPLQAPIGVEYNLKGVIDLITQEAVYFDGANGFEPSP
jgi:elongation factor G